MTGAEYTRNRECRIVLQTAESFIRTLNEIRALPETTKGAP